MVQRLNQTGRNGIIPLAYVVDNPVGREVNGDHGNPAAISQTSARSSASANWGAFGRGQRKDYLISCREVGKGRSEWSTKMRTLRGCQCQLVRRLPHGCSYCRKFRLGNSIRRGGISADTYNVRQLREYDFRKRTEGRGNATQLVERAKGRSQIGGNSTYAQCLNSPAKVSRLAAVHAPSWVLTYFISVVA